MAMKWIVEKKIFLEIDENENKFFEDKCNRSYICPKNVWRICFQNNHLSWSDSKITPLFYSELFGLGGNWSRATASAALSHPRLEIRLSKCFVRIFQHGCYIVWFIISIRKFWIINCCKFQWMVDDITSKIHQWWHIIPWFGHGT